MDLADLFHKDCRPDSYMRMLTALMLFIPISILMNQFLSKADSSIRHFFAHIVGFIFKLFIFRGQIVHFFIMATVTYLLMHSQPRKEQHKYVMAWLVGYLSFYHVF